MRKRARIAALALAALLFTLPQAFAAGNATERVQDAGLMTGYTDGNFHEEGIVTRGQIAQILYSYNTGETDASAYAKLTSSFTDISGHWAAGAIKYCAARNYVRGRTATEFAPDDAVTVRETAKMLLICAFGANESRDGLSGPQWEENTDALAEEYGLYARLSSEADDDLTRGDAAQMLCNMLDAQ